MAVSLRWGGWQGLGGLWGLHRSAPVAGSGLPRALLRFFLSLAEGRKSKKHCVRGL